MSRKYKHDFNCAWCNSEFQKWVEEDEDGKAIVDEVECPFCQNDMISNSDDMGRSE